MNKKWKGTKKNIRSSPVLFEDEEMGTSLDQVKVVYNKGTPSDEMKVMYDKGKSCATPQSKRFKDHSTPIVNKVAIDSPELHYNESPIIEPLTQHPPSEVGWDYRQSLKDDEDGNPQYSMDTGTPKRSTNHLLSKKRNSNSPLLYKPVKKKLIQDQQREKMDFMNTLKEIHSTAKEKIDDDEIVKKTDSSVESQLVVDMELVSDDSDMKLQVSANTNESPGQAKNEDIQMKTHNALLDDSIEDMMVLCSQEIEAKEFGTKINHNNSPLYTIKEYSSDTSHNESSEKVFKNPAKENIQPLHSIEKGMNISDISSRNSSKSSKSESFPDDSFDDFFVAIDDKNLCPNTEIILEDKTKTVKKYNKPSSTKIEDTLNKSSEQQKKFFQSKSSSHVESKSIPTSNKNFTKTSQNEKVFKQTKVVNENASYGYLNKDYMRSTSVTTAQTSKDNSTSETRLFKAKSFSDSNFYQQNHQSHNLDRSQSNVNFNSMYYQKQQTLQQNSEGYSSGTGTSSSWRRFNSSSSIGTYSQTSVNILTNSEGSQSRSAEEIERKRLEALERRKKRINYNAAQRRPLQQPLRR